MSAKYDCLFIAVLIVFILVVLASPALTIQGEITKCEQLDNTSIPHEWSFCTGCRVQRPEGMWVGVDDWYSPEYIISVDNQ